MSQSTIASPEAAAVGFVTTLRKSGLDVALTSSLLYADALAALDITDPNALYWSGRATLVHSPEGIEVYDTVFRAYWLGRGDTARAQPAIEVPLTIELDDGDAESADDTESERGDDTLTVRYSATETLATKDFADYSDAELAEARRLMARMRFEAPTRHSRRRQPSRSSSGAVDARRTMRMAMRNGGEPIRVHRRVRGRRPRRIVFVLDVSGSMETYARALLRFVHAAIAGRTRVEGFALGTRLTRLTRELSQRDPDRALTAASGAVEDWSGGTRLGAGLRDFNDEWGCRGLARGAVVVVLSDGWDRGEPDELLEQMQRLHRVAHRVVWVNPLKASEGYEPLARGMAAALPFVDHFVEGHNLRALEQLAEIVLRGGDGA